MGNYCYGENFMHDDEVEKYKFSSNQEKVFFNSQGFKRNSDFAVPRKCLIFGELHQKSFLYEFSYIRKKFIKLPTPKNIQFKNYSGVTQKNAQTLIICGGIKSTLTGISQQCFELNTQSLAIKKLPDMINYRYTFPVVYMNNCIYVIGGRQYGNDEESILKKCEKYDYEKKKWIEMADLNVGRCTQSAIIYNEEIWVLGGYTGRFQRSKKVEKYIELQNKWVVLEFRLFQGFENGIVYKTENPNEILILGGKKNYGQSKACWLYNLQNNTVINKRPLTFNNIIPKYQNFDSKYLMILSEFVNNQTQSNNRNSVVCEIYSLPTSQTLGFHIKNYPIQMQKMKQNNCNQPLVQINCDIHEKEDFSNIDYQKVNLLFGSDSEPFQIEIYQETAQVKVQSVPTKLFLLNFQGVCRISANEIFIAGGISSNFRQIHQKCQIYNLQTRKIQKVDQMLNFRYTFPLIKFKNYLYAIGGREFGANTVAIMKVSERYNLITGKWETIQPLNIARCTSSAFVYDRKLFVAGGFTQNGRTDTIEIFNEENLQWSVIGISLLNPLEASIFLIKNDQVCYFGGRIEKKGDQNTICKVNLRDKDFGMCEKIGRIKTKMCLHKMFYVIKIQQLI